MFGASGMVGQGVLRECLVDSDVEKVLVIGRKPLGQTHAKLQEIVHPDLYEYASIETQLRDYDACFFCLGISVIGQTEASYRHVIYDLTIAAAQTLVKLNPGMTFTFVTGLGTDSTERGSSMWARVKGQTENALLKLPFKAAYMFRPGLIEPLHGIKSKTPAYQIPYIILRPVIPFLLKWLPKYVTTTEILGRAMLKVAKDGAPSPILESEEINRLGSTR